MLHCKKKDCQYISNLANGPHNGQFCDYIGWTGRRRGVYGKDLENCPKYTERREVRKRPTQSSIGSEEYIMEYSLYQERYRKKEGIE